MGQVFGRRRLIVSTVLVLGTIGCTVSDIKTPQLEGPSALGLSFTLKASPDILSLDGASQAEIWVTARDHHGQPAPNVTFRAEIVAAGQLIDCGALSARTLVTGIDGRAVLTYTAPAFACDTSGSVAVYVTPFGTDAANSVSHPVYIRLVPPGVVLPGGPTPRFSVNGAPTTNSDGSPAVTSVAAFVSNSFDASGSVAAPGTAIGSVSWNFGDGSTANGPVANHTFTRAGTFGVVLTVTDTNGIPASILRQVTATASVDQQPTADFVFSPSAPRVGQDILFNASTSTAGIGRSLVTYEWNFGSGVSSQSGVTVRKSYSVAGNYTVVLTVTDDVGQTDTDSTSVSVTAAPVVASFTFSPTDPHGGAPGVSFNASASTSPNGTIVSYVWDFGDGTSGVGVTPPPHQYPAVVSASYVVRLTVTDSNGDTATSTQTVPVAVP